MRLRCVCSLGSSCHRVVAACNKAWHVAAIYNGSGLLKLLSCRRCHIPAYRRMRAQNLDCYQHRIMCMDYIQITLHNQCGEATLQRMANDAVSPL